MTVGQIFSTINKLSKDYHFEAIENEVDKVELGHKSLDFYYAGRECDSVPDLRIIIKEGEK